jgi:hypothetical protein
LPAYYFRSELCFTSTMCLLVHSYYMTPDHCVRFLYKWSTRPLHIWNPAYFYTTYIRPMLGCRSLQATVVVLLHLLTSLGILLVGGEYQSLFLCFSVNSVIISRLRNEYIWQENTEQPSLLPSPDHLLFIQTTVTGVLQITGQIWSSHTAPMSCSEVTTLIIKINTSFNLQIWGINYTTRHYREVSQHSTNHTSSWNS